MVTRAFGGMNTAIVFWGLWILWPKIQAECPKPWITLFPLGLCVRFYETPMTWAMARTVCQKEGGELVMIKSRRKELLIAGAYTGNASHFWIGVFARLLRFQYIDGTDPRQMWLGPGHDLSTVRDMALNVPPGLCVVQNVQELIWGTDLCTIKWPSVCEKVYSHYYGGMRSIALKTDTKCTPKVCECNKYDWTYFQDSRKFVVINKVAYPHVESMVMCEMLGGHLLTIHDVKTQNNVEIMNVRWQEEGSMYWIGLTKDEGASQPWRWVNGVALTGNEYSNWLTKRFIKGRCAGVEWDFLAKWGAESCQQNKFHICESEKPCAALPTISINERKTMNAAGFIFAGNVSVNLHCTLRGYGKPVSKVTLACTWSAEEKDQGKGEKTAMLTISINHRMHREKCVCAAHVIGEKTEESEVMFSYHGRPHLISPKRGYNRIFVSSEEEVKSATINHTFVLFSSPRPRPYTLKRGDGSPVVRWLYKLRSNRRATSAYISMSVLLKASTPNVSGEYMLLIDNGFKKTIQYRFSVDVIHIITKHPRIQWTTVYILLIIMSIYLMLRMATIIPGWKVLQQTHSDVIPLFEPDKRPSESSEDKASVSNSIRGSKAEVVPDDESAL